jgi:hypothetical protein
MTQYLVQATGPLTTANLLVTVTILRVGWAVGITKSLTLVVSGSELKKSQETTPRLHCTVLFIQQPDPQLKQYQYLSNIPA